VRGKDWRPRPRLNGSSGTAADDVDTSPSGRREVGARGGTGASGEDARLAHMHRSRTIRLTLLAITMIVLGGCDDLVPRDTASLLLPEFRKSEILGFVAGLGTTCAGLPDLVAMFRRRSSAGMNPRMAAILGTFQILWIYYGLLIASRPVILWNIIAVVINFLSVGAYQHFARLEDRSTWTRRPKA
jgi:MtN3 and saliva related transmembrane protein